MKGYMQKNDNVFKRCTVYKVIWGLIVIAIFTAHCFCKFGFGDDVTYSTVLNEKSLLVFLQERYRWWSSRVVIESVMVPLIYMSPWIWRIMDTIMIIGSIVLIEKMFGMGERFKGRIIFFCIMLTIPLFSINGAGWITTTTNYVWVLASGLASMYSLKKYIENSADWKVFLCSIPAILYSCNMEQMTAILLGAYIVVAVYMICKKRELPWMYFAQLMLVLGSVFFILHSEGNGWRVEYEIEHHFPLFRELSALQKTAMGFLLTSRYYVAEEGKWIFILLNIVLVLVLFANKKKWWKRIVACMPLLSMIVLQVIKLLWSKGVWTRGLRLLEVLWNNDSISAVSGYSPIFIWIQGMYYLFIWVCVFFSIYWSNERFETSLLECIIATAGLLSRIILGFSPTVYASGERTALFASVALLIVVMRGIIKLSITNKKVC